MGFSDFHVQHNLVNVLGANCCIDMSPVTRVPYQAEALSMKSFASLLTLFIKRAIGKPPGQKTDGRHTYEPSDDNPIFVVKLVSSSVS